MQRLILVVCLLLTACSGLSPRPAPSLPRLHLAPADLGRNLAAQQQLTFFFGAQQRELQALLEVDAREVRLAVEALGQSGVRLRWDGQRLDMRRADWLPPQVRAERVLDDLQFAFWPAEHIRAALPRGWSFEQNGAQRRLLQGGRVRLQLDDIGQALLLDNRAEGYRLRIRSHELESGP